MPDDFDAWVTARGDSLLRLAWLVTGGSSDAEALVQEALARVRRQWHQVVGLDDPDAHVRRVVLDAVGSARRRGPEPDLAVDLTDVDTDDEVRLVWSSFQALTVGHRTVLVLRSHEGLDDAGIASLTGRREPGVRAQVARADEELRQRLAATVPDPSSLVDRLPDVLRVAAERSPRGSALVAQVHARVGQRHRRRLVLGGVATVLLALSLGRALTDTAAPPAGPPPATPVTAIDPGNGGPDDVPAGYHVEQYRGVSVHVPNTWSSGALADWCHRADSPDNPVVERPGTGSTGRPCEEPRLGHGLQFLDPAGDDAVSDQPLRLRPGGGRDSYYPPGAWVGVACARCGAAVRVVARDRYVARYVLGTVISTRG